jgi:hypothetical protein
VLNMPPPEFVDPTLAGSVAFDPVELGASYYRDGGHIVAVLPGMPTDAVRVAIGRTPREAWFALADGGSDTPVQSTGPDSGVDAALQWAANAGWTSPVDRLEAIAVTSDDLDSTVTAWQ